VEKVGERLVEERKRLAKTVAGMAEECSVSKQAQINFEKGRQLPGGAYLIAAAALGVDIAYVLTGQPNSSVRRTPGPPATQKQVFQGGVSQVVQVAGNLDQHGLRFSVEKGKK